MPNLVGKQFTHYHAFEPSYGVAPSSSPVWQPLTVYSTTIGENIGFEDDPVLGRGEYNTRDPGEGAPALPSTAGDVTVPLCLREIGWWLKLVFGAPATTEDAGVFTHVFESGKDTLPSMYRQQRRASDDWRRIPGIMGNTFSVRPEKTAGFAQATIGLIGRNEAPASAALTGTLEEPLAYLPVPNAKALAKWGGLTIGAALNASWAYNNNLDPLLALNGTPYPETIDPGFVSLEMSMDIRYRDQSWVALAAAGTEDEFTLEYALSATQKLTITTPLAKLQKTAEPVSGPGAVTASYSLRARQAADAPAVTITLINDVEAY